MFASRRAVFSWSAVLVLTASPACHSGGPSEASADEGKTERPRPATVRVATAQEGSVTGLWSFPGEIRARARASLAAGAAGAVERVTVEIGDRFREGALLVEVDRDLAAARLAVAEARVLEAKEALAQAEREAGRLVALEEGVVPEQQREQAVSRKVRARAELEAQRAGAREARAVLDLHRVRAPFDGYVSDRRVDRGDWVRVGDPTLEIVSAGGVDVIVDAGRALVGKVKAGDEARLAEAPGVTLRVVGVVPALDPATRTLRVRLRPLGALPPRLLPGTSTEVEFRVTLGSDGGLVIPEDAVLFDGQRSRIVREKDGKAELLDVEVVARSGEEALVRSKGLSAGDKVVVRGNERVRPGQPLSVEGAR